MTHTVRLVEHHELGPVAVDRSYLYLPEEGTLEEVTEGYRRALAPFIADMEAQAQAWVDSRGIEISPSIRTSGGRRMEVWLVWDVEVGRASYDDEGRERWAWSAYYDAVAEAMP